MYEPRVSLGALAVDELLFGSRAADSFRILTVDYNDEAADPSVTLSWASRTNVIYATDYSTDLNLWFEIDDDVPSEGETTTFTHQFLPESPELVGTSQIYYRVKIPGAN